MDHNMRKWWGCKSMARLIKCWQTWIIYHRLSNSQKPPCWECTGKGCSTLTHTFSVRRLTKPTNQGFEQSVEDEQINSRFHKMVAGKKWLGKYLHLNIANRYLHFYQIGLNSSHGCIWTRRISNKEIYYYSHEWHWKYVLFTPERQKFLFSTVSVRLKMSDQQQLETAELLRFQTSTKRCDITSDLWPPVVCVWMCPDPSRGHSC